MPDMARIRVILLLVLSLACLQCNGGGTNTNTTDEHSGNRCCASSATRS